MSVTIYHNPRCSKSRQTLQLLRDHGVEPEVVEYLKSPPRAAQLDRILKLLDLSPQELMRTGEQVYADLCLAEKSLTRREAIAVLVENPKLIQRPIVVVGNRAAIGRPPENVVEIL